MDPSQLRADLHGHVEAGCTDSTCVPPIAYESPVEGSIECGLQPSEADFAKRCVEDDGQVCKNRRGWRKIVRNFTPSYERLRLHISLY